MKKLVLCGLLVGAMLIGGCGNVKFSYGGSGNKEYDSAEDFENDLEARMNEEQLQRELEEELGEAAEENESSGFLGGLFDKERKVDGYHVSIAGKEYDLRSSGTEFIGQMVRNDMAVIDTQSSKFYNEDGEVSDTRVIGSKDQEGYNEKGYLEKYFDGDNVKNAYRGKFAYAHAYDEGHISGASFEIYFNRKIADLYSKNEITKFTTPDGYTQKTNSSDLDAEYWLDVDNWGETVQSFNNPKYCALFVNGEQVKLSDYISKVDQIMEENELEGMIDLTKYLNEDMKSNDLGLITYGTFRAYDMIEAEKEGSVVAPYLDTVQHKNCAAINLALLENYKKLKAGEIDSIVHMTLEWEAGDPNSTPDLKIVAYN